MNSIDFGTIAKKWVEKNSNLADYIDHKLPACDVLKQIIEDVFLLSLKHEEGSMIQCRILFFNENDTRLEDNLFFKFENSEKKVYGLRNLAKLAMATDSNVSAIMVKIAKDSSLEIEGITSFTNRIVQENDFIEMFKKGLKSSFFNINIIGPGNLQFCFDNIVQYELDSNEFYHCQLDDILKSSMIHLPDTIADGMDDKTLTKPTSNETKPLLYPKGFYEFVLGLIIKKSIELKHGGTIIICDDDKIDIIKEKIKEDHNCYHLTTSILEFLAQSGFQFVKKINGCENSYLIDDIVDYSELVAKMTAVDLALVLSNKIEVLAFGFELKTNTRDRNGTISYYDMDTGKKETLQNKGSRHRSAYRYCKENPDVTGIIISQDGGVTFVRYDKDKKQLMHKKMRKLEKL